MRHPLWFLSGFLGGAHHWGTFPLELARSSGTEGEIIDWARETEGSTDLAEAARKLASRAFAEGRRPLLIGYSLGGRLALQAALEAPSLFSGVVALSAHPGLEHENAREERLQEDTHWAQLLLEDYSEFQRRWDERSSFKNTQAMAFPELNLIERQMWAQHLRALSTGRQEFLPSLLAQACLPLMWVAGGKDKKFSAFQSLFPPSVETHIITQAGHRLPLDAPQELAQVLTPFILHIQRTV